MESRTYSSPPHKLLSFFERSRDNWKSKHHDVKRLLKREQNQCRAVEKSRAKWRAKFRQAQQRIAQLEAELAEQQKKNAG